MVFLNVAPPDPRGPWCEQFWIYILSESFHVNMTYFGSVVLEKKIFTWPKPIFAFLRLSPLWRGPGPLFEQFRSFFTQGWFMPRLIEIGLLVLEKKILKEFQCNYFPLEKSNPLHFKNLESPLPRNDLCQFWLKLAVWFWRRSRKCES